MRFSPDYRIVLYIENNISFAPKLSASLFLAHVTSGDLLTSSNTSQFDQMILKIIFRHLLNVSAAFQKEICDRQHQK